MIFLIVKILSPLNLINLSLMYNKNFRCTSFNLNHTIKSEGQSFQLSTKVFLCIHHNTLFSIVFPKGGWSRAGTTFRSAMMISTSPPQTSFLKGNPHSSFRLFFPTKYFILDQILSAAMARRQFGTPNTYSSSYNGKILISHQDVHMAYGKL